MVTVRIGAAQRQRAEFWLGLSRRVLTFIHPGHLNAGDPLDLELRLFDDTSPLPVGGVVVSCEKRRIDDRELFRVNLLMDRLSDAVSQEIDRQVSAHGPASEAGPAAPAHSDSAPTAAGSHPAQPRPAPEVGATSSPGGVQESLAAEQARVVALERELGSLKTYAQSLENQLLDIRLAPSGQPPPPQLVGEAPLAHEHTPAYGTPMLDPSTIRALDAEREAHAATTRLLEETRARLQVIEAGAIGTHQALSHQIDDYNRRANAAENDVAAARAQQRAAEEAVAQANAALAAAQHEAGERQKALEAQLAAAQHEACERQKAQDAQLAAAQHEAGERQKALEAQLAAAEHQAGERQKALEAQLAAARHEAGEGHKALEAAQAAAAAAQRDASEQLKAADERLAAAQEALAAAQRSSAEKQGQLEAQLGQATSGLLEAEKEAEQTKQSLDAARAQFEAAQAALKQELAAVKESAAEAETLLGSRLSDAELRLGVLENSEKAALAKVSTLELQLSVNESAASVAADEAAALKKALEEELARARHATQAESLRAQAEAARADAAQEAFKVQEVRVKRIEDEHVGLVLRVTTLEGDAVTQKKASDEELKAARASAAAAKDAAEARQRTLEKELSAMAEKFAASPPQPIGPVSLAPAPEPAAGPPQEVLDATLHTANQRIAELTTEREFLAARKSELERELATQKERAAAAAARPAGLSIQTAEEDDAPSGTSPAMRWLISLLVCGIGAAVAVWLTRGH